MEKQFDVAIIGDNLQASLLLQEAIAKGLSIAYVINEDDNMPADNEPFIFFKYVNWIKLLYHIRQKRVLQFLKTNASHLLLFTEIEEYQKFSVFKLILLRFNNLFSKNKIKIKKLSMPEKVYRLSYFSYKISTNRLHQTALKSIDKGKYKTIRNRKPISIKENPEKNVLRFENNDTLITKKIINTENAFLLKTPTTYFTYPINSIKLEKTILYNTKEVSIKIIPWFEWVYFEISGKIVPSTIEKTVSTVTKYFPEISIDKEYVLVFKNIKAQDEPSESPDKKNFRFNKSDILNEVNFYQNPNLLIGSDLGIPYQPLRIMEYCDEKYDEAKHILQNPQFFKKLFYRYGTEIDKITYQAYEYWNQTKDIKKTWLMAELWYVVNYEQCTSSKEYLYKYTEEWMNGKEADQELIKSLYQELTNKQ